MNSISHTALPRFTYTSVLSPLPYISICFNPALFSLTLSCFLSPSLFPYLPSCLYINPLSFCSLYPFCLSLYLSISLSLSPSPLPYLFPSLCHSPLPLLSLSPPISLPHCPLFSSFFLLYLYIYRSLSSQSLYLPLFSSSLSLPFSSLSVPSFTLSHYLCLLRVIHIL